MSKYFDENIYNTLSVDNIESIGHIDLSVNNIERIDLDSLFKQSCKTKHEISVESGGEINKSMTIGYHVVEDYSTPSVQNGDDPTLNDDDDNDDYIDENVKVPKCAHSTFNTCPTCMSAHGILSKRVNQDSGLKIAHINVRSLFPKIDEIRFLLNNTNLDILCISEAWLDNTITDAQVKVDGYAIERNDRNRHGGGVAMYIRDTLDYKLRDDLDSDTECLWIDLKISSEMNMLLCCLYRPPSSNNAYYDNMLDMLDKVSLENKEMCVLGDLNFNYAIDETLCTNPVYHIENLYNMTQLILRPTRVTQRSTSLIDVILSTIPECHQHTDVFKLSLSDHYLIYTNVNIKVDRKDHKTVRYRSYKNFVPDDYIKDLCQSEVFSREGLDDKEMEEVWHEWKNEFIRISNKHAPLRTSRVKHRNNPWITSSIVKCMYERDYIHGKASKTDNDELWKQYKSLRNSVQHSIEIAKKEYYSSINVQYNNNPKKLWRELRRVTGDKKNENPIPSSLDCNELNEYFSNIGKNVADTIPNSFTWKWKNPESLHKFHFSLLQTVDIEKHLKSLDPESHLDILDMDSKLLRLGSSILAPSLTNICNKSLKDEYVPIDWKFARVTPVYKGKGSKTDKSNYRPISVLCIIACIMEKEVQTQIMQYFINHDFISIDQFAFLKNHSTITCLHRVLDDCLEAINESEMIGACFLDIQKCFDTIDHEILLKKLSKYGIDDKELLWFKNYLNDRTQIVACNGKLSKKQKLSVGVPQGSSLGPFLFLVFINDLSQSVPDGYINMFADDVMIYVTGKTLKEIKISLQKCVNRAYEWYNCNKLSINSSKSNVMLIGSQRNIFTHAEELDIYLGNTKLKQVRSTRYLGLEVDCFLKWDSHIQNLCRSISGKLVTMSRLRPFLCEELLNKMYRTNIQPCIDYGISIWGNCNEYNKNMVYRLQKRAARIVKSNFDFINVRGSDLMSNLKWQTVDSRKKYFLATLMFKCIHGEAPVWLSNQILMTSENHGLTTRYANQSNVVIPKPNVEMFRKSFQYQGASVWNGLQTELKDSTTLNNFKYLYKQIYF